MATAEHLKETLDHFKQQRQAKLEELRMLEITIRQLQQQVGEAPDQQPDSTLVQPLQFLDLKPLRPVVQPPGEGYKPRPDEFFSLSIAEAARTYLDKVGHAMPVEEILRVITGGGCKVGGADPKRTLSITLGQGKREFILTGTGTYGLRKFYPNIPKLGRPEGSIPKKEATKKRGPKKPAKQAKARANAAPKTAAAPQPQPRKPKPGEISAAIIEALGDHKAKTAEEVLHAVEQKIGYGVKKISVYGTLRKKAFEIVEGGKYRLRQEVSEGPRVIQ
jgi:hypothetical protein